MRRVHRFGNFAAVLLDDGRWKIGRVILEGTKLKGFVPGTTSYHDTIKDARRRCRKLDSPLTPAQQEAFERLSDEPQSAYGLRTSLPTVRNLVDRGLAKDVTEPGPGGMFSPSTHYQFVLAK